MNAVHTAAAAPRAAEPWVKVPASLVFSLPPHLLATWCRVRQYDWGRGCTAALATLAAGTMGERQLSRNLHTLEALGLLRSEERPGETTVWHCVEPAPSPKTGEPRRAEQGGGRRRGRGKQDHPEAEKEKQQHQLAQPEAPAGAAVAQGGHRSPEKAPETAGGGEGKAHPDAAPTGATRPETGAVLPMTLPPDLAELPARKKGLSSCTVRRLVGQAGEQTVRAAVELLAEQERKGKSIRSWGGMLTAAVTEGWATEKAKEAAERAAREAAISKAAPPEGTTHGRAADGQVVAVLEVKADAVVTERGVVLREAWPAWTWQTASDSSKTEGKTTRQDRPQASPPPALARVAVRLRLGKVAEAQALADQLGVEWGQVLAQLHAQEHQERP